MQKVIYGIPHAGLSSRCAGSIDIPVFAVVMRTDKQEGIKKPLCSQHHGLYIDHYFLF